MNLSSDEVLKDRLVCGLRDERLRKHILQQRGLTLEKCLEAGRAIEAAGMQAKVLTEQKRRSQAFALRILPSDSQAFTLRFVFACSYWTW